MWTRAKLARLYSPFTLGKFGQQDTLLKEILYRNILAESLWYMFPQAIIIGELALGPRYLSYALRGNSYHHIKGNLPTRSPQNRKFTLMNLNICFLPAELPLLFGGVKPSSERVEEIANFIKEKHPDVLCLYEAHEVDSTYSLYEALKDEFAHFYIDIGNDFLEFNSGLFVASKFAINDVNFKPFQYIGMQEQINKGYFEFTIEDQKKTLAKIYTTHLQPYRKNCDVNIRIKELQELVKDIRFEHDEVPFYPIVLCGDFNIPWGTCEYQRSNIDQDFYNNFGVNTKTINEDSRTYSALIGDLRWGTVDKSLLNTKNTSNKYFEIVDYALIFNKTDKMFVTTERVTTFDTNNPDSALTDHHGLITTISIGDDAPF